MYLMRCYSVTSTWEYGAAVTGKLWCTVHTMVCKDLSYLLLHYYGVSNVHACFGMVALKLEEKSKSKLVPKE